MLTSTATNLWDGGNVLSIQVVGFLRYTMMMISFLPLVFFYYFRNLLFPQSAFFYLISISSTLYTRLCVRINFCHFRCLKLEVKRLFSLHFLYLLSWWIYKATTTLWWPYTCIIGYGYGYARYRYKNTLCYLLMYLYTRRAIHSKI